MFDESNRKVERDRVKLEQEKKGIVETKKFDPFARIPCRPPNLWSMKEEDENAREGGSSNPNTKGFEAGKEGAAGETAEGDGEGAGGAEGTEGATAADGGGTEDAEETKAASAEKPKASRDDSETILAGAGGSMKGGGAGRRGGGGKAGKAGPGAVDLNLNDVHNFDIDLDGVMAAPTSSSGGAKKKKKGKKGRRKGMSLEGYYAAIAKQQDDG